MHLDVGATVAQVRFTTAGRGPCREGAYETTEANRDREVEPKQHGFRGGAWTSASPTPHGELRSGAEVSSRPLTPLGTPGPILPGVGRGVGPRASRPSTPSRPR